MICDAILSEGGTYRYSLTRVWDEARPRVLWVMLNPSVADALRGDPTTSRVIHFSKLWGFGSIEIVNLYAYRTPSPRELLRHMRIGTPVEGPRNTEHWLVAAARADRVMAAWGTDGRFTQVERARQTFRTMDCLGLNGDGSPKHPLYVPLATARTSYCAGMKA